MKITVAQFIVGGSADFMVFAGHLDQDDCAEVAKSVDHGYPTFVINEHVEAADFSAAFSKKEHPQFVDGKMAEKGDLRILFFHAETAETTSTPSVSITKIRLKEAIRKCGPKS
jgi:hypothetical protein